jgi:hypothetical protein
VGEGDQFAAGEKMPIKETITLSGPKAFTWKGEMKMGAQWVVIGNDSCKK